MMLSILLSVTVLASEEKEEPKKETKEGVKAESSASTGKNYIVGILKPGSNPELDSLERAEMIESHVEYLKYLNKNGKLYASGPMSTNPDMRGLYIFNVASVEAAEGLMNSDRAIEAGLVTVEYHEWRSRDYKPPVMESGGEGESGSEGMSTRRLTEIILVTVFTLIILVLMMRTFRMKASV